MKDILGIIVTYNPDLADLEKNLSSILLQVDKLVIVDNNSGNKEQLNNILENTNIEIIFSEKNVGLGKAYNIVLEKYSEDYKYFVTFDQDTLIPSNTIRILKNVLEDMPLIGAVGPKFSRENQSIEKYDPNKILYVEVLIQSSTLFRSSLYKKIGGFNEEYFIDSIDFEYCLRILSEGYKVAQYTGIVIKHDLGVMKKSLGINYYSHNNIRNYYIARNHLDISKKYFTKYPFFIFKKNVFFLLHILKIVILERDFVKMKYVFNGLRNKKI